MFIGCLVLFWLVSKLDEKPVLARVVDLTVDWQGRRRDAQAAGGERLLGGLSILVGLAVLMLWFNFR